MTMHRRKLLYTFSSLVLVICVVHYSILGTGIFIGNGPAGRSVPNSPRSEALLLIQDIYDSINTGVEFMRHEHQHVDLDGIIGLKILQGQFQLLLQKIDNRHYGHIPNEIYVPLADIIEKVDTAADLAIDIIKTTKPDYYTSKRMVLNKNMWKVHYSERLTDPKLRNNSPLLGPVIFNSSFMARCSAELLAPRSKRRSCVVSEDCWKVMTVTSGVRTGVLTSQMLYLHIGKMSGCFNKSLQMTADNLTSVFCATILQDLEEEIPVGLQTFCGLLGFADFFKKATLHNILDRQLDPGCWGYNKNELLRSNYFFTETGKTRRKGEEKVLFGGCDTHVTAMTLSALSQYVRYFISYIAIKGENTRHLLEST